MEGATEKMEYRLIAAGGTFDHLHDGHKAFLIWLFAKAECVLLGLTSDKFAQRTKHTPIESFEVRKQHIEEFVAEKKLLGRLKIIAIDDAYGPLVTNEFNVDVLGVTEDTYIGAEKINTKRQELGLESLPVVTMKLQLGTNGQAISSTAIRAGNITTTGEVWVKKEWKQKMYSLPDHLRKKLHEPFGPILPSIPLDIHSAQIITVGDVTTKLFNMHKVGQKISIFDFVVERAKLFHSLEELAFGAKTDTILLNNPPGHIAPQAWDIVTEAITRDSPTAIQVQGEEDLLVLVCILVAPLGSVIFYGQPHAGLVQVRVTLEIKKRAFELMGAFVGT